MAVGMGATRVISSISRNGIVAVLNEFEEFDHDGSRFFLEEHKAHQVLRTNGFLGIMSLIIRAASLNRSLSSCGTQTDSVTASDLRGLSTAIFYCGLVVVDVIRGGKPRRMIRPRQRRSRRFLLSSLTKKERGELVRIVNERLTIQMNDVLSCIVNSMPFPSAKPRRYVPQMIRGMIEMRKTDVRLTSKKALQEPIKVA